MTTTLPSTLADFIDETRYQRTAEAILAHAKKCGAHQAEVGSYFHQGLSVNVRQQKVETLEFNRDKAIGITVYFDQRKGSVSTTDTSDESIRAAVEQAVDLAKYTEQDNCAGLADKSDLAKDVPNLDLYHPWALSVEDAIAQTTECEKIALNYDKRISNSEGAALSTSQGYHIYANSEGFIGAYPTSRHSLSCVVIAQGDSGMERDYDFTVARQAQNLASPEAIGKSAAKKTIDRLNARKIPTGKMPVIFDARMAQSIFGSALNALSGGAQFRKTSFLLDSMGKAVFSKGFYLLEKPHIKGALGSAPYDSNGVATSEKYFIQDGAVTNYVLSAYSARKLNLPNTGNAGGVHNIHVPTSNDDLRSMCQQMGKGLLITELMGQGVNAVTGDYSRGASGFWVENGDIQFPVHEITVAANLKDMFQNIVKVGNDIEHRGNILTGSLWIDGMTVAGS